MGVLAIVANAVVLLLAGCTNLQPAQGGASVVPKLATQMHGMRGSYWMSPNVGNTDLIYVSDSLDNVLIYSWRKGQLVGVLGGFNELAGLCADASGNVWIPDGYYQKIVEYAHGGTEPIATLDDSGYQPYDCAIDPTTGNIAVMNAGAQSFGDGNVAIYKNAQGTPTYYADPSIAYYRFGTYDPNGNLFVDGYSGLSPPAFGLAELPKGSSNFIGISIRGRIRGPGGLAWDGHYVALADVANVYRLRISGSKAIRVQTVSVQDSAGLGGIWVHQDRLIGNGEATANVWAYPKGQVPLKKLPVEDDDVGATVSTARARRTGYRTLYRFLGGFYGPDGDGPTGNVVGLDGTIFGTTSGGGSASWGTVFAVTQSGTESVRYTFNGSGDASTPFAGLTVLDGTLYGTAFRGGAHNLGAVFAMTPAGQEHLVYSFEGGNDGAGPYGGLIAINGTLYGTTAEGGKSRVGTVFKVTPQGVEKVLHSFRGGRADGSYPQADLTHVGGALYGTTYQGGSSNYGTAFKMSLSGNEKFVYSFKGGNADGKQPNAPLTEMHGVLYGTTTRGGSDAYGTVYSLTESGSEKTLYSFTGGNDGAEPIGGLTAVNGALYGTAAYGGFNRAGTIFELTTSGQLTVLHFFKDGSDGAYPQATLTYYGHKLYGTALQGGSGCPGYGCGTLFRVLP